MRRVKGDKSIHGVTVARVAGYELVPNFSEKEDREWKASRAARKAAELEQKKELERIRNKRIKFGTYTHAPFEGAVPTGSDRVKGKSRLSITNPSSRCVLVRCVSMSVRRHNS